MHAKNELKNKCKDCIFAAGIEGLWYSEIIIR